MEEVPIRHVDSRRARHFDARAVCRAHPGQAMVAVRRGLAASAIATLVVAMGFLFFPVSGGASEKPAAMEPAAGAGGIVKCSALAVAGRKVSKFALSECTHKGKTDGRGLYPNPGEGGVVTWASGQTTTLSEVSLSEGIGSCPPNGPGYHDFYDMTGTFTNSWGGSGTFDAGWCLSPKGPYLEFGGPFDI